MNSLHNQGQTFDADHAEIVRQHRLNNPLATISDADALKVFSQRMAGIYEHAKRAHLHTILFSYPCQTIAARSSEYRLDRRIRTMQYSIQCEKRNRNRAINGFINAAFAWI